MTSSSKKTSTEEIKANEFAGACTACGKRVKAGAGRIELNAKGTWSPAHLSEAECALAHGPLIRGNWRATDMGLKEAAEGKIRQNSEDWV
jgi:hypothetical protein